MKNLLLSLLVLAACDQGTRRAPEPREPAIPHEHRCCLPDMTECQNIDIGADSCSATRVEASCSGAWQISPTALTANARRIVYLCDGVVQEEG